MGNNMRLQGNTIFITGGGSGIGRGLAEAMHKLGNKVIISGRRKDVLAETCKASPGMQSVELNLEDPVSIASVAKKLIAEFPQLNVLINNAGIMQFDDAAGAIDERVLDSTITTNLMGPIRMTSALIGHLKKQNESTVIDVTSGLAFVPMAMFGLGVLLGANARQRRWVVGLILVVGIPGAFIFGRVESVRTAVGRLQVSEITGEKITEVIAGIKKTKVRGSDAYDDLPFWVKANYRLVTWPTLVVAAGSSTTTSFGT